MSISLLLSKTIGTNQECFAEIDALRLTPEERAMADEILSFSLPHKEVVERMTIAIKNHHRYTRALSNIAKHKLCVNFRQPANEWSVFPAGGYHTVHNSNLLEAVEEMVVWIEET